MQQVLAVDLGGTNIRVAAVTEAGVVGTNVRRPTPKGVTADDLVRLIAEMAEECGRDGGTFASLGLGVPANVTCDDVLRHLPNIPTLEGAIIVGPLRDRLGLPVVIENDATAAAMGESWLGASKGLNTSILVTLGTGVGGGIIVNGEPLRGQDGGAGKIGHICVEPDGQPCGCGSRGCIEQYASGTALVRMATDAGLKVSSPSDLFDAFEKGNAAAAAVFGRMGRYLGITLAGLVNTFNPEMIVIGGGVAAGWDAFIGALEEEVKFRAFAEPALRARIVRSGLGDNAGILGAARAAFQMLEKNMACTVGGD